jgi:hypothetical protein
MGQIFHRSTNTISRVSIFGAIFIVAGAVWVAAELQRSPYNTRAYVAREQPVQFSHKHHVTDDGIDCRYCHTSVENSAFAGIPPTKTCMNCHSQLFADSPYLAPVRESFSSGQPIKWTRVHDLPDFVYFRHDIHVAKGVGCSTCHGRVDEMPLTYQVASLQMEWCLDCHRQPEKFIRPQKEIFNMKWEAPSDQLATGKVLADKQHYNLRSTNDLISCYTCHR